MSRRAQENIAAVVLLVVFAGIMYLSLDFGRRARMIPLPLAMGGFVLTLIQLVWQNLGSTDELRMDLISVDSPGVVGDGGEEAAHPERAAGTRSSWRRTAAAYAIVAGLLALVLALGPVPAVFLFTAGYFALTRHYSWRAGLIYTVMFTAAVHVLFFVILEIQPYHGLLEPLIARFE